MIQQTDGYQHTKTYLQALQAVAHLKSKNHV